jgi:eukaryotic-like serine/threonine-protein kinase
MGEVYRARDAKLKRDVAIKALPEGFSRDHDRIARFQREAEVLASLNHSNIASIYDLQEANESRFLIMELVEGETLAERISRGPLLIEEALDIARQICEALEAAHEKGIVHRDLKPGNVKIVPDGKVKVLDFGLAKAYEREPANAAVSNSPTISMAATNAGMILGTAAYMSPEQAKGRQVDRRADIFAFGAVLYEMLTGRSAFQGDDVPEILSAVIRAEPDFALLPPNLSPDIHKLLRRCLEKNPSRRWQAAGDLKLELEAAIAEPYRRTEPVAQPGSDPLRAPRRKIAIVVAATAVIASVLTASFAWIALRPAAPRVARFTNVPPGPPLANTTAFTNDIAVSPDGRRIVYVSGDTNATQQLYVRSLDELYAKVLPGISNARDPFISPDGNWIGFWDGSNLKKVAINGGPAVSICKLEGNSRGAAWGSDGRILLATDSAESGLLRVSAAGGTPEIVTKPDPKKEEVDHLFPEILPGGRAVLFTIVTKGPIETAQIAVLDLETNQYKVLIQGGSNAHYAASGHIVYGAGGTLRAVAFDLRRLELRGDPVPVVERVIMKTSGAADFAIAQDGALVYVAGDSAGAAANTLVWVDRQGHEEPLGVPPRAYNYPRISPSGTQVALDIRDQENDIWIWDFLRRTLTRLTFDPGLNRGPTWTPDGKRLAFSAQRDETENIYWQAADGTGAAERLTKGSKPELPNSFSPDGKHLLFNTPSGSPRDIGIVNLDGEPRAELLIHTPFNEFNANFSPDGRWIAYESEESGRAEVYVRPFPDINSGRWQVSVGGGTRPVWARNGRELFYYIAPGKIMTVPVEPGASFKAGTPQMVFEGPYPSVNNGLIYDVSPDGRRFLMIKTSESSAGASSPPQLVVVLNWLEELKQHVPVN